MLPVKIADLFKVEGYGVIVTGGASGLGLGFAEALAEQRRQGHAARRRCRAASTRKWRA